MKKIVNVGCAIILAYTAYQVGKLSMGIQIIKELKEYGNEKRYTRYTHDHTVHYRPHYRPYYYK